MTSGLACTTNEARLPEENKPLFFLSVLSIRRHAEQQCDALIVAPSARDEPSADDSH